MASAEYHREYWRKNKQKLSEYRSKWYYEHGDEMRRRATVSRRADRQEVLDHYGSVCACCGEGRWEFVAIDHIHGGGTEHRRKDRISDIYKWLKKNNYPEGYRVLCHNCNSSLGYYGYCPHQKEALKSI